MFYVASMMMLTVFRKCFRLLTTVVYPKKWKRGGGGLRGVLLQKIRLHIFWHIWVVCKISENLITQHEYVEHTYILQIGHNFSFY